MKTKTILLVITGIFTWSQFLFAQVLTSGGNGSDPPIQKVRVEIDEISFCEDDEEKAEIRYNGQDLVIDNNEANGELYLTTELDVNMRAGNNAIIIGNDNIYLATGPNLGLTRLFINTDGEVGIGTANPATQLHVTGGTDVSGSGGGYLQLGSSSSTNIGIDGNEIQARNNGAASNLFLQNSGGLLDIGGDTDIDGELTLRSNGGTFILRTATPGNATGDLQFVGDGTTHMSIDDENGFVGIGTSNPAVKLNITGGSDAEPDNQNGYLQLGPIGNQNLVMDDNEIMARNNGTGADLSIQREGGNLLLCGTEDGSVGIGISNSNNMPTGYLLAVDGRIIAEEVRVELSGNWPDYVFEEDYNLLCIDELANYVEEKGHLPGIPSAREIEEEGLNMGDMQRRMMEKIEELSLYVIQLSEENETIKTQLATLKTGLK